MLATWFCAATPFNVRCRDWGDSTNSFTFGNSSTNFPQIIFVEHLRKVSLWNIRNPLPENDLQPAFGVPKIPE